MPTVDEVTRACERARQTLPDGAVAEIAFFGGSFTAIDRADMVRLLEAAAPFVKRGDFEGIRVSTRPDAVDAEVLAVLRAYGVTTVELGAQSMVDDVLIRCGRGHTAAQVRAAANAVHEAGLSLGLQMMTGLPSDTDEGAWYTARELAALQPRQMRIYPTLVMEGTPLEADYRAGRYQPQTLEQAVSLCEGLLTFFEEEKQIPVIRLGLHAEEQMQSHCVAGPFHPAFREVCESRLFLRKAQHLLADVTDKNVTLRVHPTCVSRMVGHKRENLLALQQQGFTVKVAADESMKEGEVTR